MIKIGSLFSGIGGFELGVERAIPNSKTIWQVEQNDFCKKVLKKHWPDSIIYNDVRDIKKNNVESVHVLLGGFPCQDISIHNSNGKGLNGKKSSMFWEMFRVICELRPPIVIMENVANIINRGADEVFGALASIGYDSEWAIIKASDFGYCHQRKRWFAVAYPVGATTCDRTMLSFGVESELGFGRSDMSRCWNNERKSNFGKIGRESAICRMDDGISDRVDRIRALGNAIVPDCSEWVAKQILKSGLLNNLMEVKHEI